MTAANARDAILEAADRLFGEVGFEGATTRLIGDASGVNKALIHYHFKDKKDLWNAVLDRYYEELGQAMREGLAAPTPPRERLKRLLGTYLDFLAAHTTFARMVQREAAGGRHVDRITAHMVPLFAAGTALVRSVWPAARDGDLGAAHLLVSFYGMAVTWVTYAPVVEGLVGADPLAPAALAERKRHLSRMVDLIADALEAPPATTD